MSPPSPGFLLGTRQTLLETNDFGKTWEPRTVAAARARPRIPSRCGASGTAAGFCADRPGVCPGLFQEEEINYRFNSISFKGKEGWIVGKPAILLHSDDAGATWCASPAPQRLPAIPLPPCLLNRAQESVYRRLCECLLSIQLAAFHSRLRGCFLALGPIQGAHPALREAPRRAGAHHRARQGHCRDGHRRGCPLLHL